MSRSSFWLAALLPGLIACGSNSKGGGTTAGDAGDGGDGGHPGLNGACTAPDNTQGGCPWPEFCLAKTCTPPQNLNAQGQDIPANACVTSSSTVQGAGNLDLDRSEEDAGLELLSPLSAIIMDLQQIPIQSDQDCVTYIGHNTTEYQESAKACAGGNTDAAGVAICADREAAVLFKGDAFDPEAHFAPKEGTDLDAQFYWMTTVQAPTNFTAVGVYGAAQSGFIIPGTGWSKSGGPFIMAQCLAKSVGYPLILNADPVTLHFADTTTTDAGVAGNSFCTTWSP
jgi:hypothetical protein